MRIEGVHKEYLDSLLALTMSGIFIVIVLMSALYWLALRLFTSTVSVNELFARLLQGSFEFYSVLIACAVTVVAILILLLALRNTHYLRSPFKKLELFQSQLQKDKKITNESRVLAGFYKILRERLFLFILAGMSGTFILLAALYLATLSFFYSSGVLSPGTFEKLLSILSYYGLLTFFTLILSMFLLLLIALRKLRQLLGIEANQLKKIDIDNVEIDFESLCRELDRELIVSTLVEHDSSEGTTNE
jgi:hypothetical protein